MANLRRTEHASFSLQDDYELDPVALLRGVVPEPSREARILARALLTGREHVVARSEWDVLMTVPEGRWVPQGDRDPEAVRRLLDEGLLISDGDEEPDRELRERDAALTAAAWDPLAASYHYMHQWTGVDIGAGDRTDAAIAAEIATDVRALVTEHGAPPAALPHLDGTRTVALPARTRHEPLFRALVARRTTRAFDPARTMALDDLDAVLRYVFGAHGTVTNTPPVTCVKRTSPSAGGLHPVTVYPIVSRVDGVAPGIYHYNMDDHSLTLVEVTSTGEARELAGSFMCGQRYFGEAHVSFLLVARFYRNHWKYRRHPRAYASLLMDAAHLSQTLYLVAAELGLGAFVTIGINGRDIESRLGLDGVQAGAIAVCGCGPRAPGGSPLEPVFRPSPPPVG